MSPVGALVDKSDERRQWVKAVATHRVVIASVVVASYVLVMWWGYRYVAVVNYSYIGLSYRSPWWPALAVGFVAAVALTLLLPRRIIVPSDFVLWFLATFMTIPAVFIPQWTQDLTRWSGLQLAAATIVSFAAIVLAVRWIPVPGWRPPQLSGRWLGVLVASFTVIAYGSLIALFGSSLEITSLTDVRDLRIQYLDRIQEVGPIPAYLLIVQGNVINPLVLLRGLRRRSWWLIGVGAAGQIAIYSATGYRTILLSVPAIILLSWLFRLARDKVVGAWLTMSATVGALVASVVTLTLGSLTLTLLVLVRTISLPAVLTAANVAWYEDRPKALWAYSFMSPFFDYPEDRLPAQIIGMLTSNDPENYANTGYLGDGYANWGYPGIFVGAIVLIVVLVVLDWAARGLPPVVCAVLVLAPTMIAANVSAFTSVLSGGFAAAIVAAALLPRGGWEAGRKSWIPAMRSSSSTTRRHRSESTPR